MSSESHKARAIQEFYQKNPLKFMVDVLDVEPKYVWSKMEEMVNSVRDNQFTAIKAGNSLSKSYTLGRIALWFLYCFKPSTVVTTAPSNIQVEEILWREIASAHAGAKKPLGGECMKTTLDLQKAFTTPYKWFATGFATKPDNVTQHVTRFQGFHNEYVLIIFDEAAGVMPEIWEAKDRLATNEKVKFIAVGNPTISQGDFVDCFKNPMYNKITVSVFDTPNYKANKDVIPGLSGRPFVEMVRQKYGEDSNQWKSMVTGEIPQDDINSLIPINLIEKAQNRKEFNKVYKTTKRFVVWDVADGGNDLHTIWGYENSEVIERIDLRGKTVEEAESYVWRLLRQIKGNTIVVDGDGIGRIALGLLEQTKDSGTEIISYEGSSRVVNDPDVFYNKRDESHWMLRGLFYDGDIIIPDDEELIQELAALRIADGIDKPKAKMQFTCMEPKKKMKQMIGRSPDKCDNLVMMAGTINDIKSVDKERGNRYSLKKWKAYPFNPQTV